MSPERLKAQFPSLTPEDLEAYVTVTSRVLEHGPDRARQLRQLIEQARQAREKAASGQPLEGEDALLARYIAAVDKMQGSTAHKPN